MRGSQLGLKVLLLITSITIVSPSVFPQSERVDGVRTSAAQPIIWRHPGNISKRNLYYGPGSPEMAPVGPFSFIEEDKGGESPKVVVRDARGHKWTVKLGPEAQAETVSTRLVWSVGYFAEEAYYLNEARINGLPRLSRGQDYVSGDTVRGARFEPKRSGMKRGPTWSWHDNPFENTRELSGLKVLMILLNNFDARSENNRLIYVDGPRGTEARHYVTDLGATLGRAGGLGGTRSKNDLADFLSTKFVRGVDAREGVVEFDYDTRPSGLGHLSVLYPPYYRHEVGKEKAMRGIPVTHAKWIGSLLNQLSDEQLRDAFRAAGYSQGVRESYVGALRQRINQLTQLRNLPQRRQRSASAASKIRRFNSEAVEKVETTFSYVLSKVRTTIKRGN
jgi:hypothetical protein